MSDEIRTERLVLRRARMDDAAAMHRVMSDHVAMRYWSTPPHFELAKTERWLQSMVDADSSAFLRAAEETFQCAAVLHCGVLQVRLLPTDRRDIDVEVNLVADHHAARLERRIPPRA